MTRYFRKPGRGFEAVQWDGEDLGIMDPVSGAVAPGTHPEWLPKVKHGSPEYVQDELKKGEIARVGKRLYVGLSKGRFMVARPGDYLFLTEDGLIGWCDREAFEDTYEARR